MKQRRGEVVGTLILAVAVMIGALAGALNSIGDTKRNTRIKELEARVQALEALLAIPTDTVYPSEAP